jgi:Predicted flavoproteins
MTIENKIDVVIVGAGAAGLMCAIEASKRGKRVLVIEKSKKIAGKIFISGGGRCNFTNIYTQPKCYVSHNHHFCKSALSRYTHWDFLALLTKHDLSWHEKEPKNLAGYLSDNNQGQLFCDQKSQAIIDALLSECQDNEVKILTSTQVQSLSQCSNREKLYHVVLTSTVTDIYQDIYCNSVVIATGGPSIPKMGATEFARDIAKRLI